MKNYKLRIKKRILKTLKFLEMYKSIFDLLLFILEVASVALVLFTLVEMRIERHHSYRPIICIPEKTYAIQHFCYDDYGSANEWYELPETFADMPVYYANDLVNESYPTLYLDIFNIGVGAAQDVQISISRDSCIKAIEQFNISSSYCKMQHGNPTNDVHNSDYLDYGSINALQHSKNGCTDSCYKCSLHDNEVDCNEDCFGYECILPLDDHWSLLYFEYDDFSMPYILPNAEQSYKYPLPTIYYCLINAMRIEIEHFDIDETNAHIPDIELKITYTDVQGVQYEVPAIIHTKLESIHGNYFSQSVSIDVGN